MQNHRNINLIIAVILTMTTFSCFDQKSNAKAKIFSVQVAFEPDFYNESRIDTLELSKPSINDTLKNVNQLTDYVGQKSLKIEEGNVTISAFSLFERKYSKTININSDTSITFLKKDFPIVFEEKEKWDNDLNLKKIDTIAIYYFNSSCFTTDEFASRRIIYCFKNDTSFLVKYTDLPRGTAAIKASYKTKKCNANFISHLKQFYLSAKKEKEKKQEFYSTINAVMFIRIDNTIFQIIDPSFSIGNLYDKLIKSINSSQH